MQESLFTVAKLDDFVPSDHPLRAVQVLVNEALGQLSRQSRNVRLLGKIEMSGRSGRV